jgi:hypothetical protein
MMGFLMRHQPPLPHIDVWMAMSDEEIIEYFRQRAIADRKGARDAAIVVGVAMGSVALMAVGFIFFAWTAVT